MSFKNQKERDQSRRKMVLGGVFAFNIEGDRIEQLCASKRIVKEIQCYEMGPLGTKVLKGSQKGPNFTRRSQISGGVTKISVQK